MANNYFGLTDTGRIRQNNEDTFIAEPIMEGRMIAACVIDGVGGYEGGEVAAQLAREAILHHLSKPSDNIISLMKDAVSDANASIYQEKQQGRGNERMACVLTLALADIANNKFHYAHVGDTRLYLFRDNSLVKVTRDHSFVGFLEDSGRLSEEAAMRHPKRNEINKALGFDSHMQNQADYIETGDSPFLPGDTLLLCSDGLTDMIGNNTITSILSSDQQLPAKAKALIHAANDAGGKDNITVVLVQNDKAPLKHEATKPVSVLKKNDNTGEQAVVVNKTGHAAKSDRVVIKKKNGTVSVLAILCILLLAAFLYYLFKDLRNNSRSETQASNAIVNVKHSEEEQALLDTINSPSNNEVFVVNSPGAAPIVITDSIIIKSDSLHIIGNGAVLKGDSTYSGPALTVLENAKYILLDSLTLENFNVGILAKSPVVHLKNVRFKNCKIPVQYNAQLADDILVNGRFADTIFYNTDTLVQQ